MKTAKKFSGVSLVELLIGITIMGVLAATITLSANSVQATAKSEAEKVAQFLRTYITKADKLHGGYFFKINENEIRLKINNTDQNNLDVLKASSGCTYIALDNKNINYNTEKGGEVKITGRNLSIQVKDKNNKPTDEEKNFWITVTGKGDPYYAVVTVYGDTTLK